MTPPATHDIPSWAVFPFVLLTFAISWSLLGLYVYWPDWAAARFGDISGAHPFFFLATWAPAIAGFIIVTGFAGLSGLRRFLSRLFLWRGPWGWALFILIGIPLVFIIGSLLKGGSILATMPPEGAGAVVAILMLMLALGPIEEFGWRGVAQPLLQRHLAPVWAGALIGLVWGLWHLPAFFLAGTVFGSWNFLPFLIGNVTLAVLVTPILNSSRGSLLWPMLFHWQLINPFWPDAQPYDTWILVVVLLAVLWWHRDRMFHRGAAVTQVVPV